MQTLAKSAPLGALGLPEGDHIVKMHVAGDAISFEVASSLPAPAPRTPTGFVQKWGGSARKVEDASDSWLSHINEKHLR